MPFKTFYTELSFCCSYGFLVIYAQTFDIVFANEKCFKHFVMHLSDRRSNNHLLIQKDTKKKTSPLLTLHESLHTSQISRQECSSSHNHMTRDLKQHSFRPSTNNTVCSRCNLSSANNGAPFVFNKPNVDVTSGFRS